MNLSSRLDKIENLVKSRQVEKSLIALYNEFGKPVDGEVVKMPMSEAEGVARLADGTEKPIIYEAGWNNGIDIFQDETLIIDNETEIDDVSGKLIIRNKDNTKLVFKGVDLTKFPKRTN